MSHRLLYYLFVGGEIVLYSRVFGMATSRYVFSISESMTWHAERAAVSLFSLLFFGFFDESSATFSTFGAFLLETFL